MVEFKMRYIVAPEFKIVLVAIPRSAVNKSLLAVKEGKIWLSSTVILFMIYQVMHISKSKSSSEEATIWKIPPRINQKDASPERNLAHTPRPV
ncbi:unnamed protein product [Clonostachys rosea f. rosea IK726]|uniref:Uncharacterized protein n=1 Tax=Clonostachys rosea f. rosea IK726 TaxID=1349383 RepID=A0ACA9ULS6_BIOOC|nr:unnamed protein product [Clonostachys rosea f. rosea IK726]